MQSTDLVLQNRVPARSVRAHRRPRRAVGYLVLALLVVGSARSHAANKLRVCKQLCGASIDTSCVGLKKGKFKKCRKHIWKLCKRDATVCQPPTTTAPVTTTTVPLLPPTTTTVTTTTQPEGPSTTATLPPLTTTTVIETTTTTTVANPFGGPWAFHGDVTEGTCGIASFDDRITVTVQDGVITATLESEPGSVFAGTVGAGDDLALSADGLLTLNGCSADIDLTLDGPLTHADQMTTGTASFAIDCPGGQCQASFAGTWKRSTK